MILTQVFEIGGKRKRRFELADSERKLSDWQYEVKRLEVATSVATAYAEVVGAQRRVEVLGEWAAYHEELGGRVAKLIELGSLGSVEAHRVTRAGGEARIELETARGELTAARHRLAALWGSAAPRFTVAEGELGPVTSPPPLESVLDLASRGPAVAQWDAEADRGEAALKLAKAERVPRPDLRRRDPLGRQHRRPRLPDRRRDRDPRLRSEEGPDSRSAVRHCPRAGGTAGRGSRGCREDRGGAHGPGRERFAGVPAGRGGRSRRHARRTRR